MLTIFTDFFTQLCGLESLWNVGIATKAQKREVFTKKNLRQVVYSSFRILLSSLPNPSISICLSEKEMIEKAFSVLVSTIPFMFTK
jgi:hypothetical protein